MNSPHVRLVVSWMTALALLWAALMPHLLLAAPAQQTLWIEACTSKGPLLVALETGEETAAPVAHGHCPFCRLHEDDTGLAPMHARILAVDANPPAWVASATPPTLFISFAWRAPQSRAPPRQQA